MSHNGGRAQVNVTLPAPYYDYPFLNACKMATLPFTAVSATDDTWYQNFDSRGYPTQMPNGAGAVWHGDQIWIYGQTGDIWVLDWPGTATLTLTNSFVSGGFTETSINANRKEYTFTGSIAGGNLVDGVYENSALLCRLTISSMSPNAFAGGDIRLFRKDQESLINAGQVFQPGFISRMGKFGVVRFMDWCFDNTTGTISVGQWADRKSVNSYSYFSTGDILSNRYCGSSTGTNAQVVSQPPTAISSWTQGQLVQWKIAALPVWRTPSAATNASPAVFTDNGHGLNTGDKVYFIPDFSGWRFLTESGQHSFGVFTVTRIDANTFSLPFDSTSSGAWPGIAYTKVMTLQVGSLAAVPIVNKANTSNLNNVDSNQSSLRVGDIVTGVYDATLGYLMIMRDGSAGNSASGYSALCSTVPYEHMISFANQNGCHPWVNIPPFFDDASITSLANLLISNLNLPLVPRIEWSNEVWNYDVTGYAQSRARVETAGVANFHEFYGKHISDISSLFKTAYTGSGKPYEIMMGVQSSFTASPFTVDRFQAPTYFGGVSANYPVNKCDAIVHAPYFETAFSYTANAITYPNGTSAGGWADQVWNYTQGGAARQTAFNWYKNELINNSSDLTNFPTQQPIGFIQSNIIPFWKNQANIYSKKLYEYEGGQTVAGRGISGGFPGTAPTSGQPVTVSNVNSFYVDFLQSQQYADVITLLFNNAANGGTLFPSYYTCGDKWQTNYYWGIYPLNLTVNGIGSNTPTLAYTALRSFNDIFVPGHKNIKDGF